jgi:hypothetical protein
MDPLTTDPGLYFRRVGERLIGMFGCYVNFVVRCGTPEHLTSLRLQDLSCIKTRRRGVLKVRRGQERLFAYDAL